LLAMHAPDRVFSMPVNVVFGLAVALLLGVALRRVSRRSDHRAVAMMGVSAAFIFAAQMVNFPIASGTTGHLLGGTLAAILLGPWAGTVVMTAVIVVQALVFHDGGVTVLGPNIFNMGIIGTMVAYFVYRAVIGRSANRPARVAGAAFFAAWLAVALASVFVSIELAVSGTVPLNRVLPPMLFVHMAIGVGEGLITASVVVFVMRTRPDLLYDARESLQPVGRPALLVGLGGALLCAMVLSLLPALWDHPDGLEFVGQHCGFLADDGTRVTSDAAAGLPPDSDANTFAVFPNYLVGGVNGLASTGLAGAIGTVLTFVVSFGVGRILVRPAAFMRSSPDSTSVV
jgi:cobalt/nickel transport system permease protein